MSAKGKHNTPWRKFGSLSLPGSLTLVPRRQLRICQAPAVVGPTPVNEAIDLDAITAAIALERVVIEPRKCKNEMCGKRLTIWNKDESGLCFACQRSAEQRADGVVPLREIGTGRCACGSPLYSTSRVCRKCIEKRSSDLKSNLVEAA